MGPKISQGLVIHCEKWCLGSKNIFKIFDKHVFFFNKLYLKYVDIAVPADGLKVSDGKTSAATMMTSFRSHRYIDLYQLYMTIQFKESNDRLLVISG